MNYDSKKINISASNVKGYYDSGIDEDLSLQAFVNKMLGRFFDGRMIEIADKNKKQIDGLAEKLKCTNQEAVNHIFNRYEFVIDESPKPRIKLDKNVKEFRSKKINPITDF